MSAIDVAIEMRERVGIADRMIRRAVMRQSASGMVGRRVQRAIRLYLRGYFDQLEAATPWAEIERFVLLRRPLGGREVPRWRVEQWAAEAAEHVVGPTVDALSDELEAALFGPLLFARYAALARLSVLPAAEARREGRPRGRRLAEGEWVDRTAFADTGEMVRAALAMGNVVREDLAAWISTQTAPIEQTVEAMRTRGARLVTGLNETSKRRLADVIARGMRDGKGVPEIAWDIRSVFPGMRTTRARLIALNETNTIMSEATHERAAVEGAREKAWVTVGDDRVTPGCQENEAEGWIAFDDEHLSGHPHPPRFIGCRCAEVYRGGGVAAPDVEPPPRVTPEQLDAAIGMLVGRLPGVTYKSGLALPPTDFVKAIGEVGAPPAGTASIEELEREAAERREAWRKRKRGED